MRVLVATDSSEYAREEVSDAVGLPGAIGAFDAVRVIRLIQETCTPFSLVHVYDALDEPQFILVPQVILEFTVVTDD
jgi:hypothetical protein